MICFMHDGVSTWIHYFSYGYLVLLPLPGVAFGWWLASARLGGPRK